MIDGMGFEEVNQQVTQTVYVSGTMLLAGSVVRAPTISGGNIYATILVQADKIVGDTEISGAQVYSTGSVHGERILGDTIVESVLISGTNVFNDTGELQTVSAGSDFGAIIQAGSDRLYTNSVWVEFATPYTAGGSPIIMLTNTTMTGSLALWIGSDSIGPGSFQARGLGASDEFNWISVGI